MQIKAELLEDFNSDLGVVNAARVSMGKWKNEFDNSDTKGSDLRLCKYLINAKPAPHFSTLTHSRETFEFTTPLRIDLLTETDLAGMVFANNARKVRHSIFGWANLINKNILYSDAAEVINRVLSIRYPNVWSLLVNVEFDDFNLVNSDCAKIIHDETDPRFVDATFRVTAPIPVARQQFKHVISFGYNETSRRYVSDEPDILTVDEWRSKPDGNIKQGSGGRHKEQLFPKLVYWLSTKLALSSYNLLVKLGYAPEQARGILPQNMMTQYIVTGSLAGWGRMLTQRLDSHAQYEIRELAKQVQRELIYKYGSGWDES